METDRNTWLAAGMGVVAGFAAGILAASWRLRHASLPRRAGGRAASLHTPEGESRSLDEDLRSVQGGGAVQDLRRQEDVVRSAIAKIALGLGTPGADQIGLTGKIAGLAAELTKLEARRRLAEADAAAVPFPDQGAVDRLRQAVGELERAVAQGIALTDLLAKTSAAIEAWKA